jgi:cytochrome c556
MLRLSGWTLLGVVLAISPSWAVATAGSPFQAQAGRKAVVANDVHTIMKKKLSHTQKALEGIALNNFETIQTNAEELMVLSKQAEWMIIHTPEYELQTDSFRRSAQDLVKAANNKNVDGAALAYVELTMSCVKCHKYVRDTRRTQLTPLSSRVLAANGR